METKNIQNKFSTIYKIVNFLYWVYIVFIVLAVIFTPIIMLTENASFGEILNVITNKEHTIHIFIGIIAILWVVFFLFCNIYVLHLLRAIALNFKNWDIFTEVNAGKIKTLFWIFGVYFVATGIIVSGGIISLSAGIFVWILYEIFFIGFDYKIQNEKLTEENNLTI